MYQVVLLKTHIVHQFTIVKFFYLSLINNNKQDKSTAITTSNIKNQSVANAVKWNGLINDLGTNNTVDTWVPVLSDNKLQHRVIPINLIKAGEKRSNYTQIDNLNCGYDWDVGFVIDFGFADGTTARLTFNNNAIAFHYYNGKTWDTKWEK